MTSSNIIRALMVQSNSNEWITPQYIIDAARQAMGSIDLDPASSDIAQQTVQAQNYYTKAIDGFKQPWSGNIWMNPPYGQRNHANKIYGAPAWVRRLVKEFHAGSVTQACILIRDGNSKFPLLGKSFVCEPNYRIKFIDPLSGQVAKWPQHVCSIHYLGERPHDFANAFKHIGAISRPY